MASSFAGRNCNSLKISSSTCTAAPDAPCSIGSSTARTISSFSSGVTRTKVGSVGMCVARSATRTQMVRNATAVRARISCSVPAGIQSARCGGTSQWRPAALISITPESAWMSCARLCECLWSTAPRA
ncbi:MAG: hypothetical protein WDN49_17185 [Acetobacteraceae bacterium]